MTEEDDGSLDEVMVTNADRECASPSSHGAGSSFAPEPTVPGSIQAAPAPRRERTSW